MSPERDEQALAPLELTPALMLNNAIEKGVSVEGIQALAEIYERMEAKRAEREFTEALLKFKADCPPIFKEDKGVHDKKFAPLYKITDAIDPILLRNGLSYTWDTQLEEKQVVSLCTLRHVGGHSTVTRFVAPIDPAPKMSQTHAAASAASLANRYSLQFALGVVTKAMVDDDGKAATGSLITPAQVETLRSLLKEIDANMAAFWRFVGKGVTKLEDIAAYDYERVHQSLVDAKKRQEGKK